MKKFNRFVLFVVLAFAVLTPLAWVAQAGELQWRDGKLGILGRDLNELRQRHIAYPSTSVAATGTVTMDTSACSFFIITDEGVSATPTLSLTGGVSGQIVYIYNGDASATSGIATISSGKVGSVIYASGAYRLLSDE